MRYGDMRYFVMLLTVMIALGCGQIKGPAGSDGLDGSTGDTGAQGSTGAQGVQGLAGSTGSEGVAGATGPSGAVGATGAAGLDATPITTVQFCSGYTASYGTFPEYGLCMGGKLYGVYDGGEGNIFLGYLAPGGYSSTSAGAPCSFTVVAGCQIQ